MKLKTVSEVGKSSYFIDISDNGEWRPVGFAWVRDNLSNFVFVCKRSVKGVLVKYYKIKK